MVRSMANTVRVDIPDWSESLSNTQVLFLSGLLALILLRTLHRDIAKYNELATAED